MTDLRLFASLLLILAACGGSEPQKEIPRTPAENEAEEAIQKELACLEAVNQVCQSGVWFVLLQDPIADLPIEELGDVRVEDSVRNEGGYLWVNRTLYFPEGRFIIEGDFIDAQKANDSILNATSVNRIRIEHPAYKSQEGIAVGNTVAEIQKLTPTGNWQVQVIPDYQIISLQKGDGTMPILHIADPGNEISDRLGETLSVETMDPTLQISAMVVM
ncbi:MAG: hypothetical protein AAF206_28680 [Bacteroidota bacterium]